VTSIPLNRWTLERFGVTPSKIRHRLFDRDAPKILCVSIPKAGTHLAERAICLHPRLYRKLLPTLTLRKLNRRGGVAGTFARVGPGEVVMAHLRFDPAIATVAAARGLKTVFVVRDPRDIAISQARYVTGRRDHWAHDLFADRSDPRARLRLAIAGDRDGGLRSLGDRLDAYAGWLDTADVVVRFEDLVGSRGGGDDATQRATVARLYERVGIDADEALIASISSRLFSSESPTFRKGAIGQWREVLDDELQTLVGDTAGESLARFGYGS
jgi:sulfotransferase 6B1